MCWDNSHRHLSSAPAPLALQATEEADTRDKAEPMLRLRSQPSQGPRALWGAFLQSPPPLLMPLTPWVPLPLCHATQGIAQPLGFPLQFDSTGLGQFAMPLPVAVPDCCSQDQESDEPLSKRRAVLQGRLEGYGESSTALEPCSFIEQVPDECLEQVLSYVSSREDRMNCSLVCRRWLHVLSLSRKTQTEKPRSKTPAPSSKSSKDVMSRTLEGRSACDVRLMAMAVSLEAKGGLEKLVVRSAPRPADADVMAPSPALPLTATGFQAIAQCSPNLRSVAIWGCDWLDDESVAAIARRCQKLEKLDIMNCPRLSDKSLAVLAQCCPRLSVLSLASCQLVTDRGLGVLSRGCKRLVSLSLSSCPLVVGKGIAAVCSACPGLASLKLAGAMGVTDQGLRAIGETSKALRHLRLYQMPKVTEEGFSSIGQMGGFRGLKCLTLASCAGLTCSAFESIGKGCPDLRGLRLMACDRVLDQGLASLLQSAPALEYLVLHSLSGISVESARLALEHGKHLRSLTIAACIGVTDAQVSCSSDWVVECKKLTNFRLTDCSAVGNRCLASMSGLGESLSAVDLCNLPEVRDEGVVALLSNATDKLTAVDLSGCAQITDWSVAALAEKYGSSLRTLSLEGCSKVSDKALHALAKWCTALEDLDLSGCDISDIGVLALLEALGPSLVNFSLAGCARVTDRSLDVMLDTCHSMSGLNVKNCHKVSKGAMDRLKQQALNLLGPSCLFIGP